MLGCGNQTLTARGVIKLAGTAANSGPALKLLNGAAGTPLLRARDTLSFRCGARAVEEILQSPDVQTYNLDRYKGTA